MKTMNTLRDLQENFVAAVFESRDVEDIDSGFSQSIKQNNLTNSISGERRLQVYHNNIFISLTDALKAVYPVVNRLVGDEFFKSMSNGYIKKHPSQSGNLHEFGSQFAHYVGNFPPANGLIYLNDIAKLEWAYHTVFHAVDSSSFNLLKLQQVNKEDYDKLVFKLNPASRLIKSPFPILRIWKSNQDFQEPVDNDDGDAETISLDEGETLLLVIRRELDVEFQLLNSGEYAFLDALNMHTDFSTACESALQVEPKCDVGQILQNHIQSHTIVNFEIPE